MSTIQKIDLATRALAGLTTEHAMDAQRVSGSQHEANSCGEPMGCHIDTP